MELERLAAKDVMSKNVVTIHFETSLQEALETLSDERISGAPVVDEAGKPVGVISLTDLVKYEVNKAPKGTSSYYTEADDPDDVQKVEEQGELEDVLSTVPVTRAMTPLVVSVKPGAALPEVAGIMARQRIHRVLVVEKGKIVGLVSSMDLLKALAKSARVLQKSR
jgi:CBS domain-containing protein